MRTRVWHFVSNNIFASVRDERSVTVLIRVAKYITWKCKYRKNFLYISLVRKTSLQHVFWTWENWRKLWTPSICAYNTYIVRIILIFFFFSRAREIVILLMIQVTYFRNIKKKKKIENKTARKDFLARYDVAPRRYAPASHKSSFHRVTMIFL